jgi:hypothetical protein
MKALKQRCLAHHMLGIQCYQHLVCNTLGVLVLLARRNPPVVAAMAAEHITLARQEAAASSTSTCADSGGGTAIAGTSDGGAHYGCCSSSNSAGGCSAAASSLQLVLSSDQVASCRAMSSGQVSLLRVLRMGLELRASNTYQAILAAGAAWEAEGSAALSAGRSAVRTWLRLRLSMHSSAPACVCWCQWRGQ